MGAGCLVRETLAQASSARSFLKFQAYRYWIIGGVRKWNS